MGECEISSAKFTFKQQETAETKNRIRAAWASFYSYRMIRLTQRKMLRLISKNEKDEEGEKENHRSSDEKTVEGSSSNTD